MTDVQWLESICSTEESRKPKIGHPWTMRRADGPWTVATNGYVMALIRGDYGYPPVDEIAPNFEAVIPVGLSPRRLPLTELRQLATPWAAPAIPDCETCKNTGSVECAKCDGEGDTECQCHCGDEHDVECRKCDGKGTVGCKECVRGDEVGDERRPVRLGGVLFDLCLFAKLLPNIPGDVAEFHQQVPDRAALLTVGEWTLVVAPLREIDAKNFADVPHIEFEEPAHVL